jgi:hypothetical protein
VPQNGFITIVLPDQIQINPAVILSNGICEIQDVCQLVPDAP